MFGTLESMPRDVKESPCQETSSEDLAKGSLTNLPGRSRVKICADSLNKGLLLRSLTEILRGDLL